MGSRGPLLLGMSFGDPILLDQLHYDTIVLGTGVCESIVAGALARAGKSVLHLDHRQYYGGNAATVDLQTFATLAGALPPKEETASHGVAVPCENVSLSSWAPVQPGLRNVPAAESTPSNVPQSEDDSEVQGECEGEEVATQPAEAPAAAECEPAAPTQKGLAEMLKDSRRYNLDLAPALLLANGKMVGALVSSGVHNYCEFKSTESSYMLVNNTIRKVPSPNNEVFADKQISLLDKRCLMKFLQLCLAFAGGEQEEGDSKDVARVKSKYAEPFIKFLKAEKLSKSLQDSVLYAIAQTPRNQSEAPITTEEGMNAVISYLQSVGRFGPSAFLACSYGIGELPQGFCRLGAVHGAIYVLDRGVEQIATDNDSGRYTGVLCSAGQNLTSDHLVCAPEYATSFHQPGVESRVSRCVCITDCSLFAAEGEKETYHALLTIPPGAHKQPIQVLQFGCSTSACPEGQFVLYFSTVAAGTPEEDLQGAVHQLLVAGEEAEPDCAKPCVLWGTYYQERLPVCMEGAVPAGMFVTPSNGPSACHPELACEAAKRIFEDICGVDTEFLPKAEEPEDDAEDYLMERELADMDMEEQAAAQEKEAPAGEEEAAQAATETFIDKLALILVEDRKQLVARTRGKTAFFTPGGKREKGESDEEALTRECREELTIELKPESIQPYGVFQAQAFGKPEGTMVRMTCYTAAFNGTVKPDEEIEELRWIDSSCPHEDLSVTGVMILEDLKAKDLVD